VTLCGRVVASAVLAAALAAASAARARSAAAEPPPDTFDAEAELRRRADAGAGTHDPEALRTWAHETAEAGRARPGTVLGGDLLAAAADELLGSGVDPARALEWAREAVTTYPAGAPGAGLAWLHVANAQGWLEDPAAVLDALAAAEAVARRGVAVGASLHERLAADELVRRLDESGPLHRARALTALARHAEAAEVYEVLAGKGARGGLHAAGRMWREAALASWRAGDRERARAAGRHALDYAGSDDEVVDRTTWSLLAAHGLLDAAGEVRLTNEWPGAAFAAEARTAMRSVEGRRGAWRVPLQVAGFAMLAREDEEALAFYEAAFRDPSFAEEVRTSPFYRQAMVTAAHVALRAKRPEDALRWLQAAERWAGGPIPHTELLRTQIDERLAAEERPERDGDESVPPAPVPGAEAARGGARLGAPTSSERGASPDGAAGSRGDADDSSRVGALAWAGGAVAAAVLLAALLTRRRRPPR
jgi:hypothetical protein